MKITYKLLWAEDQPVWYSSFEENILNNNITDMLEESGFLLESVLINFKEKDTDDFLKVVSDYDLLIIDYNLTETTKGSDVIKAIRDRAVLTNIIFYSQKDLKNLRDDLYEKGVLDGIYFSLRDTDALADKLEKVIDLSIRKSQDVNALRGLLMAETSDMDILVVECLKEYFNKSSSQEKEVILKYAKKKIKKFLKDFSVEKLSYLSEQHEDAHFEEVLKSMIFDAYKKSHTLHHALKELHKKTDTLKFTSILENYPEDIIQKRNVFAHVKETTGEDGLKKLISHSKGIEPIDFDASFCSETRKSLRKHKKNLDSILEFFQKSHENLSNND